MVSCAKEGTHLYQKKEERYAEEIKKKKKKSSTKAIGPAYDHFL